MEKAKSEQLVSARFRAKNERKIEGKAAFDVHATLDFGSTSRIDTKFGTLVFSINQVRFSLRGDNCIFEYDTLAYRTPTIRSLKMAISDEMTGEGRTQHAYGLLDFISCCGVGASKFFERGPRVIPDGTPSDDEAAWLIVSKSKSAGLKGRFSFTDGDRLATAIDAPSGKNIPPTVRPRVQVLPNCVFAEEKKSKFASRELRTTFREELHRDPRLVLAALVWAEEEELDRELPSVQPAEDEE